MKVIGQKFGVVKYMALLLFLMLLTSIAVNGYSAGLSYGERERVPVPAQDSKINVVTSTALLKDFVENIGGDLVDVSSAIIEGNQDPHTYEPTPSDLDSLVKADVFFLMGRPDLEPWWEGEGGYKDTVLASNPELQVVKVMNDSMVEIDPLTNQSNPHGWTSPVIAKMMVRNIYMALLGIASSDQEALLTSHYMNYINTLDELLNEIQGNRTILEGTKVVMHHPAMMYLYDLLGVERIGIIEEKHGVEPSAQRIQEIKEKMVATGTQIIVHQSNLDDDQIIQLARETNSSIVLSAPLIGMLDYQKNTINTYVQLIRANIGALLHPLSVDEYEEWANEGSSIDGFLGVSLLITALGTIYVIVYLMQKSRIH